MRAPSCRSMMSSVSSMSGGLRMWGALDGVNGFGNAVEGPVEVLARDDKGRRAAHDGLMRLLREHARGEEKLADGARIGIARLDIDAGQQALAAHGADRRALDRLEALHHMGAQIAGTLDQAFLLDDAQRDEPDRRGQGITAESRAMRAGREYVHQLARAEKGRNRQHAAAQRLAEDQPVRADLLVLEGEPRAGASEAGLDLVDDEEDVVLVAERAHAREPAFGRDDDPAFALDRLDQHGGGLRRDRRFDRGEIAEGHGTEAWRERAEAVAVLGFRGEADDRGRAAVEIPGGDDDLGAIGRDALDAIAPAPRGLDRGLDRFGAGVHRQGLVEPGKGAELLEEGPEPVAVEGARRHGEPARLGVERRQNA